MTDTTQILGAMAKTLNKPFTDVDFARHMDAQDEIAHMRQEFTIPKIKTIPVADLTLVNPNDECVYFCGHSLGLMPKRAKTRVQKHMKIWEDMGVLCQFMTDPPGSKAELSIQPYLAKLLGAKTDEVCVMNGLSASIHFLMISFYRPLGSRHKILMEHKAFPSDHYVVMSQIRFHGFNPEKSLILMEPRQGEKVIRHEDLINKIREEGESIALIWIGGVQYYTGQLFDMKSITEEGHKKGCSVGFDLAHAAGNVPLQLHDWNVDFAALCSYKYLNCGGGTTGAIFVHERHANKNLPRLEGWWGHRYDTRFTMNNQADPIPGAAGYATSNPSLLHCELWLASMDVFDMVPIEKLRSKSILLTGYLAMLIEHCFGEHSPYRCSKSIHCSIVTPNNSEERGAMLCLNFSVNIHKIFEELEKRGIICDKRLPSVIRVAPVPLYCKFEDVHRFIEGLKEAVAACERA